MTAERETMLANIITTAVEGGINYWANITRYKWYSPDITGGSAAPAPNGGGNAYATLYLEDGVHGGEETYELTPEVAARGLELIADGGAAASSWIVREVKAMRNGNGMTMGFDATCADVVVQAGLFGEVVFG